MSKKEMPIQVIISFQIIQFLIPNFIAILTKIRISQSARVVILKLSGQS